MNINDHLAALQVVVPLFAVPLIILLQAKRMAWLTATVTSTMSFVIAIAITIGVLNGNDFQYFMGSWPAPYGIELRIDELSAVIILITTGASTAALLAGGSSVDAQIEQERQPYFYAAWLLALAGLCGIAISADAFNIFVFMEISSLAAYVLVAGGPNRKALPAVFRYLIFGTIGATFYLIGVGLIYMMTGTLNIADMEVRVQDVADQSPVIVAAGFITVGLALKAAIFPLHIWLPNAYTYSPHAVTAFIAACSTKVALYVLLRFDFFVFQNNLAIHEYHFGYFLMPLAVLAILIPSAVALFEKNLKKVFAWSSLAQIGYIMLGASLVSASGLTSSVLHMFNHAIAKGGLFLAIMCLAMRYSNLRFTGLAGSAKRMPWTMAAIVIGGLSLIGVPGTAGFISKWYLITAALEEGAFGIGLVVVIIAGSLLSVAYIWRIVECVYFQPEPDDIQAGEIKEAPLGMLIVTWVVALANIYFGFETHIPVSLATFSAAELIGHMP